MHMLPSLLKMPQMLKHSVMQRGSVISENTWKKMRVVSLK